MRVYGCNFIILAAIILVSCGGTKESADAASPAAASGQSQATQIPAATALWVRLDKTIDSARAHAGDQFTAEVSSSIVLNGRAVIPKGAKAVGHVTSSALAGQPGSTGMLTLQLDTVRAGLKVYKVQTQPVTLQSPPVKENPQSDPMAKRAADAVADKAENLQFALSAPVAVQ